MHGVRCATLRSAPLRAAASAHSSRQVRAPCAAGAPRSQEASPSAASSAAAAAQVLQERLGLSEPRSLDVVQQAGLLPDPDVPALEECLAVLMLSQRKPLAQRLVGSRPQLLSQPLAAWWDFLQGYGLSHSQFLALLDAQPALFTHAGLFNAGAVILQLKALGMTDATIHASILARCPAALGVDVQTGLVPLLAHLRSLGVEGAALRDLLAASPRLLLLEQPESALAPHMQALAAAGFAPEQRRRLLRAQPWLLAQQLQELAPKLEFLQQAGFSGTDLVSLLLQDPGLLACALPNLQRKWRFLSGVMGVAAPDLLLTCPTAFSASLLHNTGPRFRFVAERGLAAVLAVPMAGAMATAAIVGPSLAMPVAGSGIAAGAAAQGGGARQQMSAEGPEQLQMLQQVTLPSGDEQQQLLPAGAAQAEPHPWPPAADAQADPQPLQWAEQRLHLGLLLAGPDAEFVGRLGVGLEEYTAFAEAWLLGEGLQWAGTNHPYAGR